MILFNNRPDVVVYVFPILSVSVGLVNNNNKYIQIISMNKGWKMRLEKPPMLSTIEKIGFNC